MLSSNLDKLHLTQQISRKNFSWVYGINLCARRNTYKNQTPYIWIFLKSKVAPTHVYVYIYMHMCDVQSCWYNSLLLQVTINCCYELRK